MQITVTGDAAFKRFALACENAAGPDFDKHLRHGLKLAGEDIGQAIVTASDIYLPSGYEVAFGASERAVTELEPRGLSATVRFYARGRGGNRDVRRLERGELRHPNWGRTRVLKAGGRYARKQENIRGGVYINPWSATRIRPGLFSEPVRYAGPRAMTQRLGKAVGDVFQQIGKDA